MSVKFILGSVRVKDCGARSGCELKEPSVIGENFLFAKSGFCFNSWISRDIAATSEAISGRSSSLSTS